MLHALIISRTLIVGSEFARVHPNTFGIVSDPEGDHSVLFRTINNARADADMDIND